MKNKSLHRLTACALMAALLCVLGPLSVPIGPIPLTLATLVIYLLTYIVGTWDATISVLLYLLLGAVGLPVFSGYQGGLARLAGPTGGYLAGFLLLPIVGGLLMERAKRKPILTGVAMAAGTAVLYFFGTAWFVFLTGNDLGTALSLCVYPFVPFDLLKIVLAVALGKPIRDALLRAGLLARP